MNILVIDGQGGQLGAALVKKLTERMPQARLTAVGTNALATAAMHKAGAPQCASGENPVLVACRDADVILGPIGIVIADALLGEVTPRMAQAVGSARATRILIPMNRCENLVAGIEKPTFSSLVDDAVQKTMQAAQRAAEGDGIERI